MKRVILTVIIGIALVVILSNCSAPQTGTQTLVTGEVVFNFDLSGAKAAGYNITKVHITLTHENGIVREKDLTVDAANNRAYGMMNGLRIGTWNVLAELYENDTVVGSGTTTMVIKASQATDVSVYITLATGSANITVIWDTGSNETETEPKIIWQKALGGSDSDYARSIQQTADGGYIVAGYTKSNDGDVSEYHNWGDFWVVKLDSIGNIEWQKALGGYYGRDEANSIQQTSDGGYIVAGWTYSNDGDVSENHGKADFWVVKLDSTGSIEWQKALGGSNEDVANSIQQTDDGGYIVAGYTYSNDGDVSENHGKADFWVVKLDSAGNIVWQKTFGGPYNDEARSIQQTLDGGYIVAGRTGGSGSDVSGYHGGWDFWVVKLGSNGNKQWQKALGGSGDDEAYSIQQTSDGGYIVAGYTGSNNGDVSGNHGFDDFWVVKLDSTGNIEWQKTLGGSSVERAYSIQQTSDGGYIVVGGTYSSDGYVSGNHGGKDFWVVKLDSTGNIEWQKALGGSGDDEAYSIQQTSDGGYIVAGYTGSNNGDVSGNHGGADFWIMKLGW